MPRYYVQATVIVSADNPRLAIATLRDAVHGESTTPTTRAGQLVGLDEEGEPILDVFEDVGDDAKLLPRDTWDDLEEV